MLLVKLHQKALRKVQWLSTLRRQHRQRPLQLVAEEDARMAVVSSDSFLEPPKRRHQPQHHHHQRQSHQTTSLSAATTSSCLTAEDSSLSVRSSCTRIVCMSDTHGKHRDIPFLPSGDILVHAGDFTKCGEMDAVIDLSRYFAQHQQEAAGAGGFHDVVCIAGNHDVTFQEEYYKKTWSRHCLGNWDPTTTREALQNCTYLEDSNRAIPVRFNNNSDDGYSDRLKQPTITFHGSPWTPKFFNWAFNLKRGEALQEMWSKIPTHDTDVLVTHGPPYGRGDMTLHSGHFGCQDLLQEIQQRVKPRLHIYGHIHEGYGTSFDGRTLYVNASNLDIGYEAINPCIVIDLPHDPAQPAMIVEPQRWIHSVEDFVAWLYQNKYDNVAKALAEATSERNTTMGQIPISLSISKSSDIDIDASSVFVLPEDLHSSAAYRTLCDFLGWKRRKHRPLKQELRTALCQLYAESFL